MTILVTGAGGGFGTLLMPLLKARYAEPVIGAGRSVQCHDEDYIKCDFADEAAISLLIKTVRPRLVFHLVASFTNDLEYDSLINAFSSKRIFETIISENLKTRVVVLGSAAEYGAVLPVDNPLPESFLCRPVSVYGMTKLIQTEIAKFYSRTKNVDVVIARIFNLAISGLSPRLFYGKAEAAISSYKKGEITQLEFGNLDAERDYVEIDKAAEQLFAIAEYGFPGEVYNVGSGFPRKIRSILKNMLKNEGLVDAEVVESIPGIIVEKGFDVPVIYADILKVSKLMGLA